MRHLLAGLLLWAACAALAQPLAPAWRMIPGTAQDIAVGGKGEVGAVDLDGNVFRRDARGGRWQPVGRGMTRLAIDRDGVFWAVDGQGAVRRYTGTEWRAVGQGATRLAAAPDGSLVVVGNNGGLARLEPESGKWQVIPGNAAHVAVDARGLLWAVAADGSVARRLGDEWIGVAGRALDISADGSGRVVIVGDDRKVYEWQDERARWEEIVGSGNTAAVAVGPGQIWRADADGRIFALGVKAALETAPGGERGGGKGSKPAAQTPDPSPMDFTKVASGLSRLAIGVDGSVYGLTSSGALRRWSNAERRFNEFPGTLGRVGVGKSGFPFGLGAGGAYVRHDGTGWRTVRLQFSLIDLAIGGDGDGLGVTSDGQLFRLGLKDEAAITYQLLGAGVQQAAIDRTGYWYRDDSGGLFQCDAQARCTRHPVRVSDLAVGPGGTVLIVDDKANLRRFVPASGQFDILRRGSTLRVAIGPGDRPWLVEANGDVLASKLFERDESRDTLAGLQSVATASQTLVETSAPATSSVFIGQAYTWTAADIPSSAPGYPQLSTHFRDVTVGAGDQIIVTGYDENVDPCSAKTAGWKGSNWVYSPTARRFVHLDYLKRVQFQLLIATTNLTLVPWGTASAPPAIADAPAIPALYGSVRACERYYTSEYSSTVFAGTTMLYDEGGLSILQSNKTTSELTATTRDITLTVDGDITLDDWMIFIYPERKINFSKVGADYFTTPITRRDDYKFARIGVGATRNVLWATDVDGNVYEYVASSDRFEKRSIFDADRAQDVGVGKDGSVFIVDLAGRLKKWNPVLKSFVNTGKAGVTRVAVTSKGKPVVANFPGSPRVYIAQ